MLRYVVANLMTTLSIWLRKFGVIATDNKERQRQMRFLQSREFNLDIIAKIVNKKY